jgi:N-acetylglutamate synthase-like GNAT family acetyltransferase
MLPCATPFSFMSKLLCTNAGRDLRAVYLLTTSAPGYFHKAGFRPAPRENVPAQIRGSREFAHACPASAIVMVRELAEI